MDEFRVHFAPLGYNSVRWHTEGIFVPVFREDVEVVDVIGLDLLSEN